jgi:peptidase MA superfamily protein
MKRWRAALMMALWAAPVGWPKSSIAQVDVARRARDLIVRMDLEAAGRLLVAADPDAAPVALERARLALYEMDCDAATAILTRPDVQRIDDGAALADVAHGCGRATAAAVVNRDDGLGLDVQWQDERDAPLAPLLSETVAQARDLLSRDLGVDWPRPTRVVVVRDSLSLSAMTGLPYSSAKTTGTVAVAKWGRVTLLSPRAAPHGYVWRDTVAHELTHLAVTRASGDRAPLWLQEGVAKYEESRWRPSKPFDDWPPADSVAKRGIESGHGYALDKLGPSIAMLPSAEAATVAFAEVTSFVRFYLMQEGDRALPKLLHAIRDAPDVDAALVSASGADIKAWDARWRAYLATRPADGRLALLGLGGGPKDDRNRVAAAREERDRSRLAELLLSRGHAKSASKELDALDARAPGIPPELRERRRGDPVLRWLRGLTLDGVDGASDAEQRRLFDDPRQVLSPYGPWWASRGRWLRVLGDENAAGGSFSEAVATDPLDPECACEGLPGGPPSSRRASDPLCVAAQGWADSPFDY